MLFRKTTTAVLTGIALLTACAEVKTKPSKPQLEKIVQVEDLRKVKDIRPTSYWIVREKGFPCQGKYNKKSYQGDERKKVLDEKGNILSTVCGRFYAALLMEGTGILEGKESGKNHYLVNYVGKKGGKTRFKKVKRCTHGMGLENRCLLPFYSIAAETYEGTSNHWKVGDLLYVPQMKGITLPDGEPHQGFFIVLDTGGAFYKSGRADRIDFFVGDMENKRFWSSKGFHHKNHFKAYKIEGESEKKVYAWLKKKFGDLFQLF